MHPYWGGKGVSEYIGIAHNLGFWSIMPKNTWNISQICVNDIRLGGTYIVYSNYLLIGGIRGVVFNNVYIF